jgi:hypothetical protein
MSLSSFCNPWGAGNLACSRLRRLIRAMLAGRRLKADGSQDWLTHRLCRGPVEFSLSLSLTDSVVPASSNGPYLNNP